MNTLPESKKVSNPDKLNPFDKEILEILDPIRGRLLLASVANSVEPEEAEKYLSLLRYYLFSTIDHYGYKVDFLVFEDALNQARDIIPENEALEELSLLLPEIKIRCLWGDIHKKLADLDTYPRMTIYDKLIELLDVARGDKELDLSKIENKLTDLKANSLAADLSRHSKEFDKTPSPRNLEQLIDTIETARAVKDFDLGDVEKTLPEKKLECLKYTTDQAFKIFEFWGIDTYIYTGLVQMAIEVRDAGLDVSYAVQKLTDNKDVLREIMRKIYDRTRALSEKQAKDYFYVTRMDSLKSNLLRLGVIDSNEAEEIFAQ